MIEEHCLTVPTSSLLNTLGLVCGSGTGTLLPIEELVGGQ